MMQGETGYHIRPMNFTVLHVRLILLLLLSAAVARGQARPTASRGYGVSAFGGASGVDTDFGARNLGFSGGVDFTRYFFRFQPSLELRTTYNFGPDVRERTYSGGLKVEKHIGRVYPYADILFGEGFIFFPASLTNYTHDNSVAYTLGGGADVDMRGPFALKLDFQAQTWKFGVQSPRFTPLIATVGITYRIPAHAFRSER